MVEHDFPCQEPYQAYVVYQEEKDEDPCRSLLTLQPFQLDHFTAAIYIDVYVKPLKAYHDEDED